jgi:hypothetical protein
VTAAKDRRLPDGTIIMRLTPFQAGEVQAGLDIDAADSNADWGTLALTGSGRGWNRPGLLTIWPGQANLDAALYRITSSRDIPADNAGDDMNTPAERLGYLNAARSLGLLVDRLIAVAGGRDAFSESVRKWI